MKSFIICAVILTFIFGGNAVAEDIKQTIEVYFNKIHIEINGKRLAVDNITYKDTTYVPLRKVAEMFNKKVGWNEDTTTASIDDSERIPNIEMTYEQLINEISAGKQRDVLNKLDKMKTEDRSKLFLSVVSNMYTFSDTPTQTTLENVLESMLNSPLDINIQDSYGFTPLLIAAQRSTYLVPLMLEHGANVNIRNKEGHSPLMMIASKQDYNLFKLLIDRGADPLAISNDGSNVLMWELLPFINMGFNEDSFKIQQMLVDYKIDVNHRENDNYRNTLTLAVQGGQHELIKLLLKGGADPNISDFNGTTPLFYVAAVNTSYKDEQTAIDTMKMMLEAGANINASNKDGDTTLHYIMRLNNSHDILTEDLIKYMLSQGANKDVANKEGKTPLDIAKESNKARLIKLLS